MMLLTKWLINCKWVEVMCDNWQGWIRYVLILLLITAMVSGCEGLISEVPTLAPLPTLTPSLAISPTPALGETQETTILSTPTVTQAISLVNSPTPPLGVTTTPVIAEQNGAATGAIVTTAPPTIIYFVGTPEEASPDEPVLLFWTSSNGTEAAVYRLDVDGNPGRTWAVPVEGSLTVIPRAGRSEETYVLALTNGIVTVERSFTLQVLCSGNWFFAPAPEDKCPQSEQSDVPAVLQEFENGRMFWLNGEIVVLFEDIPTGATSNSPAWIKVPDPYVEGQPVDDPAIQPPAGLRQPQRGFGVVWRETPGVSERLGWAVGEEVSFTSTMQQTADTETFEGQSYFTNPAGEVITLVPGGQGWLVAGFVDG